MTIAESTRPVHASIRAPFADYALHSVFQPVFSLSHRRTVGFEALIRATDAADTPVSPLELFAAADSHQRVLELDQTCQALHVRNFTMQTPERRWLFLNLDPNTITQRSYRKGLLADALAEAALEPHLLVIEILESSICDESLLMEAVTYFRDMGALVALDDFGAGHSNFDRIWRVAPDIIKLDRSLIVEAEQHRTGHLRQVLPNLVALMHEAGSLVLAEGIETEAQALLAINADVDFVQGFYFGYPVETIDRHPKQATRCLESLTTRFAEAALADDNASRRELAPYVDVFRAVADAIENGAPIQQTCESLLKLPRTARCYLLNEWGEEVVHFRGNEAAATRVRQTGPISDTSGGTWFRRKYFRAAMSDPRRHKISRPYQSSAGTDMCITLSIAFGNASPRVFCCDIHCPARRTLARID
ncbi:EAL domain-containing protein [Salinisphaera aquimarina]|uniref:EAL domain-containing protein n=1 Tax=Salinisphaera aquimarina TaxID=2094031 RepID=A0ABV7EUH9_9GAMM